MPPKKAEGAAAPAKKSSHPTYQDMITDAIVNLKDRNGSSRQSLKKYVKAQNEIKVTDNMFDSLFNKALKNGVDKGVFEQPKGPSGGTKLAKKKPATGEKKPAAKKAAAPKKAAAGDKKPAAKKATTKKAAAGDKKPAAKKATATKDKKPATKKAAPAVVDKPTTLTKTKTGRVAKTTATKPAAAKKAAPKKAAPKKAAAASA